MPRRSTTPDERASHLGYVFAGGGYTGVEALAELQDFASDVIRYYPRSAKHGMRWVLVEGEPRIMKEVPAALAEFTTRELEKRGIEVKTGIHVDEVTDRTVHLTTGETIPARTLVWTAGITPCHAVIDLGLPLAERGRIKTDPAMRVEGHRNVWAIGDAAAVPDPAQRDAPCPQTAQHALRQGRAVARNVAAALGAGTERPFTYKTKGVVAALGRHKGVADRDGGEAARLPGLVRRPHLSPRGDAGHAAPHETDVRLDPRDDVQPRLGGARHPGLARAAARRPRAEG